MGKESENTAEVKAFMQALGWSRIRNQQNIGSEKGIADYVFIKKGFHLWVEMKGQNGKQSEYQIKFEEKIKSAGGHYVVARGIDDIIKYMESIRRKL